jgi:hypothetical protein
MALPTSIALEVVTPDRSIIKEQVDECDAARLGGLLRGVARARPARGHLARW